MRVSWSSKFLKLLVFLKFKKYFFVIERFMFIFFIVLNRWLGLFLKRINIKYRDVLVGIMRKR